MPSKKNLINLLFLIVLMLNGCDQSTTASQEPQSSSTAPNYLRLPVKGQISTLDPGLISTIRQIELVEQLFLGLTTFNHKTYEVMPELATHWQISEDGTVYTFFLREDVTWNDKMPVTAHDIVWAVRRNIDHQTNSPYAHTLYILKNARDIYQGRITDVTTLGVRAIDDFTVEFTLTQPASYFPALVSLWTYHPLPRQLIEKQGSHWTKPAHIKTNGPYTLNDWQENKELILKKNPHFYAAETVNIPEIHYYIVYEESLALALYEKDALDIIGGNVYLSLPTSEIDNIKNDAILRRERKISPQFCTEWYGFNTQKFPTNNPLVRKAIAMALDRETLLNVNFSPEANLARTFTPPPTFGAVPPEEEVGIFFNPRQAEDWLAKAGYPQGKDFPELVLMYNHSEQHRKVAKSIQAILKRYLNIDVHIKGYDFLSYIERLSSPDKAHLFRAHWCADYPDAHQWLHTVFHPLHGVNWVGWNQREFTQLVDKASQISDPLERQQLYQRAEQILTEEAVAIIPIYFSTTQFLVKPRVKNWYPAVFGGQPIRFWRLETDNKSDEQIAGTN